MFAKWTEVNGVKCQGKTEARICQVLFDLGLDPKRGVKVDTPFGNYTPDFDCGEFYVEVKAPNSWLQACGYVPLMENARDPKLAMVSDTSLKKMEYTTIHHKRVMVVVDTTSCKKKYRDLHVETSLSLIVGTPESIKQKLWRILENDPAEPDRPQTPDHSPSSS